LSFAQGRDSDKDSATISLPPCGPGFSNSYRDDELCIGDYQQGVEPIGVASALLNLSYGIEMEGAHAIDHAIIMVPVRRGRCSAQAKYKTNPNEAQNPMTSLPLRVGLRQIPSRTL
jgi:hypothetical protein